MKPTESKSSRYLCYSVNSIIRLVQEHGSAESHEQFIKKDLESSTKQDDKICRICFEGGDYGPQGCLFRPCLCSGSVAWVHMECLDRWRKASRNPKSFYRCDQCHYEYKFRRAFDAYGGIDRFALVRMLESRIVKMVLSLMVLFLLVVFAGFIYKLFTPGLTWWDVFYFLNFDHVWGGSILVGIGSLLGWVISFGGGASRIAYFESPGGLRRIDGGREILVLLVVIGLFVALYWLYRKIEEYAERATRMAAHIVLDIRES